MKQIYDPRSNIAYLRLHEKTAQVETIRVGDELNIDVVLDGTVYGIELLMNTKVQLGTEDQGKLVVINEALGNRQEISLTR